MKLKSFETSLMEFNARVLTNGDSSNFTKDPTILLNRLFFNQIFLSNTDEMFEKYSMVDMVDTYIKNMEVVYRNIGNIIKNLMDITGCVFTREDSFERRYMMNSELDNIYITNYFTDINSFHYLFKTGEIYYLRMNNDGMIALSYVDRRRNAYKKALTYNNVYWKTDDCIRDQMSQTSDFPYTVAIKVTTLRDNQNVITKVEFNGSMEVMNKVSSIFGKKALIIMNPFLYTDDIKFMVQSFVPKVVETQNQDGINIKSLLKKDKVIEYPQDSFVNYLNFLRMVIDYTDTSEIYLTLYRIGKDPSIFYILRDAVSKGIYVNVNIELYASGEEINKFWEKEFINAGIDVTAYESGIIKVHSKLTLVKMNNGILLAQIGTGNYNSATTSQYTDLSLITSDQEVCSLVEKVFKIFKGKVDQKFNEKLLVTRYNAREELYNLIDEEADKGNDGYICIKCNALDDREVIKHLDYAAAKGCMINLIIRGVCTWVPEYENVTVSSVIWDKLEHSRVYCFGRSNPKLYIGSLDLISHKLNKRIETLVQITRINTSISICEYLNRYITNTNGSWVMDQEGNYIITQ